MPFLKVDHIVNSHVQLPNGKKVFIDMNGVSDEVDDGTAEVACQVPGFCLYHTGANLSQGSSEGNAQEEESGTDTKLHLVSDTPGSEVGSESGAETPDVRPVPKAQTVGRPRVAR
jgi:hypothetical protein